jgi:hypothetical protein
MERYNSIDPSHPLGGKDGLKDFVCEKGGVKYIGASYFPRGQQRFNAIKTKFERDIEGIKKNNAGGVVFITNQELALNERSKLIEEAAPAIVDLFHLERLASILDSPQCYGIRLEFLDIEMTKEEQLAFMATSSQLYDRLDEKLTYINNSDLLREEMNKLMADRDQPRAPVCVTPMPVNKKYFPSALSSLHEFIKCSYCGYGYFTRNRLLPAAVSLLRDNVVVCPKCGSAQEI